MTEEKWLTKRIIKYCAGTSSIPARIIYNSRISARQHQAIGFADSKTTFIANGFDTNEFRPNAESREAIYDELKIDKTHMLVGTIARNHPMKNYAALIESAIIVLKDKPAAIFVLVGPGTDDPSSQLMKLIEAHGLQNNFRCLGERHDVQRILAALTLFVLPSAWGEGFPNVVGEAMSSEVPCIVTNVGESAAIVDQNGVVVQPCDIVALADSIKYMLSKSTAELTALGRAARQRIVENYSLPEISAQYLQVYSDALRGKSEQLAKS